MELKKTAIRGASWSLIAAVFSAIIQLLRPAILTRFLAKSDFGLMAILMLVMGIAQIFSDLGVSVALFSAKDITKREYSSLYWISLLTGGILYFIIYFSSDSVAGFYDMPLLSTLIPLIGFDLILTIAGRQFQIFFQKELRFRFLAFIDVGSALISFFFAVLLATSDFGVLSLIYSALLGSFLKTFALIFFGLRSHPLSFVLDFKTSKRFYKIGLYETGAQLLDYVASQVDVIIIGKVMNASDLGVYNLIKQLIIRPYMIINSVVSRVAIPIMASFNDQLERLRIKYLEMIKVIGFINVPVYALIALFAEEIITLLYGQSYLTGVPYLQILCIWGVAVSITNAASTAIIFMGRTDLGFLWTIFRFITNPIILIIGAQFGLIGIIWSNSLCGIFYLLVYHPFLVKKIFSKISFTAYLKNYSYFFLIGTFLVLFIYFLKIQVFNFLNIWFRSVVILVCFLVPYMIFNKKNISNFLQYMPYRSKR